MRWASKAVDAIEAQPKQPRIYWRLCLILALQIPINADLRLTIRAVVPSLPKDDRNGAGCETKDIRASCRHLEIQPGPAHELVNRTSMASSIPYLKNSTQSMQTVKYRIRDSGISSSHVGCSVFHLCPLHSRRRSRKTWSVAARWSGHCSVC